MAENKLLLRYGSSGTAVSGQEKKAGVKILYEKSSRSQIPGSWKGLLL
jgi:hypothetical protein